MHRFLSETQALEITQGGSGTELAKAVNFATLISISSLSARDTQDDRLTGRKEIDARLAQEAATFDPRVSLDNSTVGTGNLGPEFDIQVADLLERRGYTFEAELRYRRLQSCSAIANRLALMLDAKGFHRESWQWYLRLARSNNVNALFRLAVIRYSKGDHNWAIPLAEYAVAQLAPDAYHALTTSIDHLVNRMSVKSVLNPKKVNTDEVYVLGSVLLVLANRPDLARLAYCSAAIRGHSLAAVSLFDLARMSITKEADILHLGSPPENRSDSFDRSLLLLKNNLQGETLERLMQEIRCFTDHAEDAIERILFTTRLITVLRGYGQLGCGTREFRYIDVTADIICGKVQHRLIEGTAGDAVSLINMIRDWGTREFNNYRQSKQRHSDARRKEKDKAEERNALAVSGINGRMKREYINLPPKYREVLILQLAGLHSGEVANALGYRKIDTDRMFADAMTRLQEAQQGEQVPAARLLGAEVDSCFSANVLELIEFLPAWSDTEAISSPRLPSNPTNGHSWLSKKHEH